MDTIDIRSPKQKIRDAGKAVTRKLSQGWDWVKENKELVAITLPVASTAIFGSVKLIGRAVNNHKAEVIKNQYIYDPRLGIYWPTKRALSGAEKLEYSRRYKEGEVGGEILRQMKILKI